MNNEDKAPSDANKKRRGLGIRNTVWRGGFAGTSESINSLQVKFDCGEGNEGGRFLECLQVTTAYMRTALEGDSDVEKSIRNGKMFNLAWPDPVGTTSEATKAMLHAE